MKKSFMFLMVSCACLSAAQANLKSEYIEGLNKWQKSYPIIEDLRLQPLFYKKSREIIQRLNNDPQAKPEQVFQAVLKEIIPDFIRSTDVDTKVGMRYFLLVEGLDPVYRDLQSMPEIKLLLPLTHGNPYKVKHIFSPKRTS